jgi:hypothetical protein
MWISCVILVLAAGGYALWPLFVKTTDDTVVLPTETDEDYLAASKAAIYRNIKELEFEYKMGRLTEADFQRLETEYKGEAAEILQRIDALSASGIMQEPDGKTDACPACGAKTIPDKKFCADCGARLQF